MSYRIGKLVYEGKAKRIYSVDGHPDLLCMEYKNSLTAFNAQKRGEFSGKGKINQEISKLVFMALEKAGIQHHLVEVLSEEKSVVRKLKMIPLEVVVRNRIAGSLAKKFHMEEGRQLADPLVEYYFKDDRMGDPFITAEQAVALGFVAPDFDFAALRAMALKINSEMQKLFAQAEIDLVDFKLEFGLDPQGRIFLADEISPDSCRLWDAKTNEKMDKDRFRHDLGKVEESYLEVLNRLKKVQGDL